MCAGTTRTPASAKGSKVGDLMVEGTYIFDCEVFAYDWLFDFKDVVTGEHISIWNDNDAVIAFMERDPFLGGFNNKHYDNFILKAVMCGFTPEEVKKVNDLIIQEELSGWDIPSLKEYRVFFDSFDLRDDCQDGISLKAIEAHLGIPIEETGVDFNIDRPLTESERRRTEYYCRYDVDATEILWKLRQGYLDNKVAVGAKRGLTDRKAMYMTNAKLTSVYLQAEKPEKPWTDERNYQYPDKLLRQYIPQEIFDFFDRLHDPNVPDIDLFGGYDQYGRKIKGASIEFRIGDCVCTIAYGGIHGAIPNYVEVATENRSIRNKDVGSYYPHLMTIPLSAGQQYGFCSRNIPSPQIFVDMLEERMKAKKAGDKKTANALKLVANTSYGAMLNGKNGISYNDLYDPLMGRSVCITGQLLLLELSMHLVAECPTLKMGLGSETTQLIQLAVLDDFDHFIKEQLHIKHYVRYNDDFIIIHEDKAYLQECLIKIDAWISSRGLKLSPKKTQLFKVTQGIKFLGFRFRLTKTGKVVMTLLPEKLSHERRKLRKLVERAKQGYMTKEEVDRCYESWKAHVGNESSKKRKSPGRRARRNCHNLIICMDQYYKNLWRESKCLDLSVQENSL